MSGCFSLFKFISKEGLYSGAAQRSPKDTQDSKSRGCHGDWKTVATQVPLTPSLVETPKRRQSPMKLSCTYYLSFSPPVGPSLLFLS